MVAGWIDETVVNNVILVLIGEQGSYKTTWFNNLLPPELSGYFYTKTNANKMGRRRLWPPTWWQYIAYNRAKQRLRKKNFPL